MPLPSSGPLSLQEIQAEFGGSNPIGLNEYYAGGGLVPAGTTGVNGPVPSSGTISVWNFYGTSNIVVQFTNSSFNIIVSQAGGTARGELFVTNGGDVNQFTSTGGSAPAGTWITPASAAGNAYQIRATPTSGTPPSGSALNTWLGLGTTRSWFLELSTTGSISGSFLIEIRNATTLSILDSATVDIEVTVL